MAMKARWFIRAHPAASSACRRPSRPRLSLPRRSKIHQKRVARFDAKRISIPHALLAGLCVIHADILDIDGRFDEMDAASILFAVLYKALPEDGIVTVPRR